MGLEVTLAKLIAQFETLAGKADAAERRMEQAIETMPAVNLLKNAAMRQEDEDGNLLHPFSIYFSGSSEATMELRVVDSKAADFPVELQAIDARLFNARLNALEISVSRMGAGSGDFNLFPSQAVRGWTTIGCLGVWAEHEGIHFLNRKLEPGVLYQDLTISRHRNWHVDAFPGSVEGDNRKFWLIGPWICAGRAQATPLFVMNDAMHDDVSGRF